MNSVDQVCVLKPNALPQGSLEILHMKDFGKQILLFSMLSLQAGLLRLLLLAMSRKAYEGDGAEIFLSPGRPAKIPRLVSSGLGTSSPDRRLSSCITATVLLASGSQRRWQNKIKDDNPVDTIPHHMFGQTTQSDLPFARAWDF
jgi:hypothetical protein